MGLTLREVRDEDLPLLFEQWADPVAVHMAAFTAPDHMDWDAFERRWSRLRADETVLARVIVVDDEVAGTIGSWGEPGEREVTYWIGRSYWGKGIASDALNAFLAVDRSRPLHARVASDNVASRRVLEKCGFRVIATERNVAEARSAEIEELCCGSTSSLPRNRDPGVEPGKPRQSSQNAPSSSIGSSTRRGSAFPRGIAIRGWMVLRPRHAPSGAKFENDVFVERPDESASGDAHAA
jgi:RimJ/RimL family protein N-acetyltransferase